MISAAVKTDQNWDNGGGKKQPGIMPGAESGCEVTCKIDSVACLSRFIMDLENHSTELLLARKYLLDLLLALASHFAQPEEVVRITKQKKGDARRQHRPPAGKSR
jgi:hypothetical protein